MTSVFVVYPNLCTHVILRIDFSDQTKSLSTAVASALPLDQNPARELSMPMSKYDAFRNASRAAGSEGSTSFVGTMQRAQCSRNGLRSVRLGTGRRFPITSHFGVSEDSRCSRCLSGRETR